MKHRISFMTLAAFLAVAVLAALPFAFHAPGAQPLDTLALLSEYLPALLPSFVGIGFGVTLAADKSRVFELGDYNDLPIVASDIIYEGAAVGDNGTNAHRPLVAGDVFKGFAEANVDNATGAAGAKSVRVRSRGRVQLPISGFDVGDVDKPVYASDDDTFTLTEGTNSYVGRAVRFVGTGTCIVAFDADHAAQGRLAELAVSVGTSDGTVADVGTAFNQTTLNNNFRDLADKINSILRMTQN